jgi:hypothetical protein
VNITDRGVFDSLRYDAAGSGNFPSNTDYVSPGIPFEGFGVRIGTSAFYTNSNSGAYQISGSTASATGGFDYGALWTGAVENLFDLTHLFYFNDGDERVNIRTTLTALTDLDTVRVSRAVDPDPDNYSPGGSASTNNQRGIPTATPAVAAADFVGSLGSISGLPLGLFYSGAINHNTGIVATCCSIVDPDVYLAGGNLGDSSSGDDGIGLGFNLGSLTSGQLVSWGYSYVMGGSLGTIDIPDDGGPITPVPLPGTLLLFGLGLAGLGLTRNRKMV